LQKRECNGAPKQVVVVVHDSGQERRGEGRGGGGRVHGTVQKPNPCPLGFIPTGRTLLR